LRLIAGTVPDIVRSAVVPFTSVFPALTPALGLTGSGLLVGVTSLGIAFGGLSPLKETHGRDLDVLEY
jgi:hypothetical protein